MSFINGFLALVSAIGAGTVTELTTPGYARQPVQFSTPKNGVSVNAIPYTFGMGLRAGIGRAIFDAPTGGNLLLILPLTTPAPAARPIWDAGDVGSLRLVLSAMAAFPDGAAFYGELDPATVVGTCNDQYDIASRNSVVNPTNGQYADQIVTAPMSTGAQLYIGRGELRAAIRSA